MTDKLQLMLINVLLDEFLNAKVIIIINNLGMI